MWRILNTFTQIRQLFKVISPENTARDFILLQYEVLSGYHFLGRCLVICLIRHQSSPLALFLKDIRQVCVMLFFFCRVSLHCMATDKNSSKESVQKFLTETKFDNPFAIKCFLMNYTVILCYITCEERQSVTSIFIQVHSPCYRKFKKQ